MEKAKEIDLLALGKSLLRKAWLIVLCAVIFGIGGYIYTEKTVAPMYQSGVLLYVNNTIQTDNKYGISANDLAVSQRLVDTYIIILRSDPVMEKVARRLEVDTGKKLSAGQIQGMVSASGVNGTEVFRVSVSSTDPQLAADVANAVAAVAPKEIESVITGSSAKVVENAKVPSAPYAPDKTKKAATTAIIGAALVIVIVVVMELLDVRIKTEEDLMAISDAPILGYIPELGTESTNKYTYTPQSPEDSQEVGK